MNIYQANKYDPIKSYLVCYPVNFKITSKSSVHYGKENYDELYSQYNDFINELIREDVKIQFLDVNKSPEQVYTRDVGFVINDIFLYLI